MDSRLAHNRRDQDCNAWLDRDNRAEFPSANRMRRQGAQDARLLVAIATVSAALAVLLLTPRNFVRVLINTPILLVSTILGIFVALESAGSADDFAARVWRLVLIGGACGAFFGHILLAIGWAFAKWLKWRRLDDRGPPTEMSISAWRWEKEAGREV